MMLSHFKYSEFDSPDRLGSGSNMDKYFLQKLDSARGKDTVPYVITSGFRTKEYNQDLIRRGFPASPNSSHLKGLAADISANTPEKRKRIVKALLAAGFLRIGIAGTFIHVDLDESKHQTFWKYNSLSESEYQELVNLRSYSQYGKLVAKNSLRYWKFLLIPLLGLIAIIVKKNASSRSR